MIEIDRNLEKYLPEGDDIIKKAMRYSVMAEGKRIRPIIAIEACRACGGSVKDVMPAACAIEFVHTYSLIHDDLPAMDDDDMRRGKPSSHKVFGEANAILAGDGLLTLAFNIVAKHMKNARVAVSIIEELSGAIGPDGMVLGQALDLGNEADRNKVNLLKTARLFAASAKIGGLAAAAGHKELKALERYGLYLGLSFQAVDDILDGESKDARKPDTLIEKAKKELKVLGAGAQALEKIADIQSQRKK